MGAVKQGFVKKAGIHILEQHPDRFNTDFAHNKAVIGKITTTSKPIQNKVAGYITRLKRIEEKSEI